MSLLFVVAIFLSSCIVLSWLSGSLIGSLALVARYLRWREFIIAFFVMAFATSLPNLFIDINAAFQGKPELAFGDIIGGNLADLTIVLAIAVFFSKKGLVAESELVLIFSFVVYSFWLFSKKGRFKKRYHSRTEAENMGFGGFLWNIGKMAVLVALLLAASQAVVVSAQFFSDQLGISLALVGILIVGLGNAFPELYFSVISARKEENWLVLGNLIGSVIICSTLVLGIIAVFFPFEIKDFSPFVTARMFLIIAALLSLLFIRSGRKITKKEGLFLLAIYILFLITEIFITS